jgi:bis(5'-nucleosyl)-tetraphosphatase (symmetrical)
MRRDGYPARVQPVFVGDVQGCGDELEEVVRRADAAFGTDWALHLVGDLVNRGPANLRVLSLVRERRERGRADVVLGNHDLSCVRLLHGLRQPGPHDTVRELLERPDADEWTEWLRRLPLVVSGDVEGHRFAMVHASVHPAWTLEMLEREARGVEALLGGSDRATALELLAPSGRHDHARDVLGRLTRCRSVGREGSWSSELPAPPGTTAWHEPWAAKRHDYGIVYGHWALQGLHVAPKLRGLDTGCVHHGRGHDGFLTAWLPDLRAEDPFAVPDSQFWHVPARRRYYPDDD